jgi:RNA polymerase sigma-70 factor, ECF subfamily
VSSGADPNGGAGRRDVVARRLRARANTSEDALRALADEDLMSLVRGADAQAFAVIYERHSGPAFALAYRMVGTRGMAEDVVQESFLALWRSAQRYDAARGSVRTWTLGIVHNRAIDALRRSMVHERRRASDEGLDRVLEAEERTDVEAFRNDDAGFVRRALGTLPGEQRRVLELAYFSGFTQTEIAEAIDAPLGTVKGRMRLGLRKLRHELGREGVTP